MTSVRFSLRRLMACVAFIFVGVVLSHKLLTGAFVGHPGAFIVVLCINCTSFGAATGCLAGRVWVGLAMACLLFVAWTGVSLLFLPWFF